MSVHEFPVYNRLDLEINDGVGVNVRSSDGREFIDFYGGHAVAALGYGHPRLKKALAEQAERLSFQTNLVGNAARRRAHDDLVLAAPTGLDRVFLINSGAEANENALRVAFHHQGASRTRVVALEGGWHGRTAAAATCTHGAAEKWYAFPAKPFPVDFVPPEDEAALDAALTDDVCALILEPIQGMSGAKALSKSYLEAVRRITSERGVLMIADEVQCGMGRSGKLFAIEHAEVLPDLLTTAKGLGGGFPVGAVFARHEIADALPKGLLGTTFGGGPMASVMVSEIIDVVMEQGFLEHVTAMGQLITELCQVGPVQSIQGTGLLRGMVCDRPGSQVLAALRARGILAGGSSDPVVVRIMPPLIIQEAHVRALAAALSSIPPLAK